MTTCTALPSVRPGTHWRCCRTVLGPLVAAVFAAATMVATAGAVASDDRRQALAPADDDDVEILLDWAEGVFPQFFPTRETTQSLAPYRFRYYPDTGNYIGVAGGVVSVLGPVSGGQVQTVGTLEQFRCQARPGNCIQSGVERIHFALGRSLGLDSRGRLLVTNGPGLASYVDTTPLPDTPLQLIASGVRQVSVGAGNGMVVSAQGRVSAWGSPLYGWMGGLYSPVLQNTLVTSPREMPWPGPVRQVAFKGLTPVALLEDGSLWSMPLAPFLTLTPTLVEPRRFLGAPPLKALSHGSSGLHAVALDGSVLTLDFETMTTTRVPGAGQVQALACSDNHCMATRSDGTVLAWGAGPLGDGSERSSTTAVVVPSLTRIVQVAVTTRQSIALDADGRVWAWGLSAQSRSATARIVPAHAADLGVVIDVVCGSVCAVRKSDGSVWQWDVGSVQSGFPPPTPVADLRFW